MSSKLKFIAVALTVVAFILVIGATLANFYETNPLFAPFSKLSPLGVLLMMIAIYFGMIIDKKNKKVIK